MDIKAFEVFNELARTGSIRQTAEVMQVSPTAIARQIDKIEHRFGAKLLVRTPRGVRLTAAGEVLAVRAATIGRELVQAQQIIDDLKGLKRGSVSLHVNGAASSAILAPALARFGQLHPNVTIEVTVASAAGALEAVASGMTDIAVTMFSKPDPRIETRFRMPVRHEPIMAADHVLAARDEISIQELARHPLALPDRSFGVRLAVDARLQAAGLENFKAAFTTSSLELQKELARRGSAILILPEMTVFHEIQGGSLVMRPFDEKSRIETMLELSCSVTRQQSLAARRLLEFLELFLREGHGEEGGWAQRV